MTRWNNTTVRRFGRILGIFAIFVLTCFTRTSVAAQNAAKPWVAPEAARKVKNSVTPTPANMKAAEGLYHDNCELCHGEKGLGDGPAAGTLNVKPANFTDQKLMAMETDGSLFWKITEGRDPMPPWKDILSDTERWELVNYIRKLGKEDSKN